MSLVGVGEGGSGTSGAGNCQCNQSRPSLLSMPSSRRWSHRGVCLQFPLGVGEARRDEKGEGAGESQEPGRIQRIISSGKPTYARTKHSYGLKPE